MDDLLTLRYHIGCDGWEIVNGKNEILGITMLPRSQLKAEAPGNTLTEKLRWVMNTGQYVPRNKPDDVERRIDG